MSNAPYDWIGPDFRDHADTQRYDSKDIILGVRIVDLRTFADEGGDFCEVGRLVSGGQLEGIDGFAPVQVSFSSLEPGTIKAWHLHRHQDDLWFVPPHGRVLVGLLDVRSESRTYKMSMRLTFGTGKARLLYIPRGVAHGVANLGTQSAHVMYFVNSVFDSQNPDEHRLPFDLLGADFWTIVPG